MKKQFQLDCFGEALLLFAAAERQGRLDADAWKAADLAVRAIAERWREPDAGIWELEARPWTHSRLTCVAGLRALTCAAPRHPLAGTCTRLTDTILAATSAGCAHADGNWQRTPDDPAVDADLLTPAVCGALPPDDARAADQRDEVPLAHVRAAVTVHHRSPGGAYSGGPTPARRAP